MYESVSAKEHGMPTKKSWDSAAQAQTFQQNPLFSWKYDTGTFNDNRDMILLGVAKLDQTTGQNPEYQQVKEAKRGL